MEVEPGTRANLLICLFGLFVGCWFGSFAEAQASNNCAQAQLAFCVDADLLGTGSRRGWGCDEGLLDHV